MSAAVNGYSVPENARKVFEEGILKNPLQNVPSKLKEISPALVTFEGSAHPSVPIVWRFSEAISAIKAFEGSMVSYLAHKRFQISPPRFKVNTDHANLFYMSPMIWVLDPHNERITFYNPNKLDKYMKDTQLHIVPGSEVYRNMATNIYRTKDNRFYHLHGMGEWKN